MIEREEVVDVGAQGRCSYGSQIIESEYLDIDQASSYI
jgi:hypothetical protein